jgi:hypothetical protein
MRLMENGVDIGLRARGVSRFPLLLGAHPVEQFGRILRNDFSFHPQNFRLT